MPLDIEQLALDAATFDELLSESYRTTPSQKAGAERAASRLASWCKAATNGDWKLFAARLAVDGFEFPTVLDRFAAPAPAQPFEPAAWCADAIWIVRALSTPLEAGTECSHSVLPFAHIFDRLIREAKTRRDNTLSVTTAGKVMANAQSDLTLLLATSLTDLALPLLLSQFDAFRCARNVVPRPGDTGTYNAFVADWHAKVATSTAHNHPILIRLICVLTRQWIESTAEFLDRLCDDGTAIAEHLLSRPALAPLARVSGGVSDLHNGGRSVLLLEFTDGSKVVYKPKDLSVDRSIRDLITVLNAAGAPFDLRAPKVLTRQGYGWAEFIAHDPCADQEEVELFFRRAGAWLALLHLLCATDMHEENMIACGPYPVPIDLEMILQPEFADAERDLRSGAARVAHTRIAHSVLSVGLLPCLASGQNGKARGVGGINAGGSRATRLSFADANTDAMQPLPIEHLPAPLDNLPVFNGASVTSDSFEKEVADGYQRQATFLAGPGRSRIEEALGQSLAGVPVRIIMRPTRFYGMLSDRLRDPESWGDGITWSVQADFLSRFSPATADQALTSLITSEREAMLDLNVPHFTVRANGTTVHDGKGREEDLRGTPALDRIKERLASYDAEEIGWQRSLIHVAFLTGTGNADLYETLPPRLTLELPAGDLSKAGHIARAREVVRRLDQLAIKEDDDAAWIGLCPIAGGSAYQLAPLAFDFYAGLSGIGYFLAAFAHSTGDELASALARRSFAGLRRTLRSSEAARYVRLQGLGGAQGIGAITYTLASASGFLSDAEFLDDAERAASFLGADLLANDTAYDVLGGAAGAILGLLKVHALTGDQKHLQSAVACGEHLLAKRVEFDGLKLWPRDEGPPLAGFAHGTAGFAYALTALGARTGRQEFFEASDDCLAYERRLYRPDAYNWPDLRDPELPRGSLASCQWCHGAGGIGHARLGILRLTMRDQGAITEDMRQAKAAIQRRWPMHADSLCCGNLGNILFCLNYSEQFGENDIRNEALARLHAVVEDAGQRGSYVWMKGTDNNNLGLFTGLAGVGYSLLCAADPTLPNPLLWE